MTTRSVTVRLDLETAQAIAKSREFGAAMSSAMDKAEGSSRRTAAAIDHVGDRAGRLALGGAAALGSIAAAAVGWESAWAGVTKTVDGSAEEMQALEDGLRGLATTLPATHDEIAGVAEAAGQLGVAREDIVDFTATMVDLGETTNLTAEEAATSIAQISNVMGTAGDDVDNFGAALVALGNDGASTEKQILDMAQRIAGAGAQIGLTEADILAVANAAASMGIEAEAGGSAISRVFTDMAKATSQGGAQLDRFAEVAGVSASEFARAFEEDPAAAFASFTAGLDRINRSGGDVFTVLDQLKLSDVRVSQALLGMAASGDLLADSLELGSQAWEDNTALAREAAKRYATTASETQVAWNQIKEAGIEAGEVLLPIIGGIADGVGTVADAFSALPDPAQNAFTHLLAIGTLTGGGLWLGAKAIGAINDTRDALSALDASSSRGARSLGTLGRAGTVAAAALGALAVMDAVQGGLKDYTIGVEAMTNDLLDLRDAAAGGELPKNLDGLAHSIERIANPNYAQGVQDNLSGILGFGGGSELAKSDAQIKAIDASLTSLLQTAGPDVAAESLEALAENAGLSKDELSDLKSVLPTYRDALEGVEKQARLTADAQEDIDTGARRAASGITYTAEQIEAAQKAYEDQVDSARGVAQEFFSIGESVDDAKVSLSEWITDMEEAADALRNFRINAKEAADNGLNQGLIKALQEAGPAGALRMKQLANATDEEIKRANRAWRRGQNEIRKYIDATTEVPDELTTTVNVETAEARRRIAIVNEQLASIDRFIPVDIHVSQSGVSGDLPYLSGGTPKSDRSPRVQTDRRNQLPSPTSAGRVASGSRATSQVYRSSRSNGPSVVGGVAPRPAVSGNAEVAIDYDRLGDAIAKHARPLYGDVHVNGDPTVFNRQLQRDSQAAGLGGRPASVGRTR